LLLSGCSSSSAFGRNVYVSSFKYARGSNDGSPFGVWENITSLVSSAAATAHFEVRANYFSICASSGAEWTCASTFKRLSRNVLDPDADPLGLAQIASRYREDVLFPGLAIGSIALSFLVILGFCLFPSWHDEYDEWTGSEIEVKPFPSRRLVAACFIITSLSCVFALLSAMWQHTSAATVTTLAEVSAYGNAKASVGAAAAAFAWMSFGFLGVAAMGILLMIASIQTLDK
ncbi:hypothetical protein NA57DRAFT_16036, partial [Rhizodiscina lignyota]